MAYFGEGKGPIHVDNVKCTGSERSLADCIKQDIGRHNCRHSEDAGVICDYLNKKASGNSNKDSLASVCGLRLLHRRQKRIIGGKNSLRYGNNTRNYVMRVGDYHTLVPEEYEEEIGVQEIVQHKEYRPDSSDYDIALLVGIKHSNSCKNNAIIFSLEYQHQPFGVEAVLLFEDYDL
ncbi:hypothetical protein lerEdw1_012306 [Lerista edwardsae]|nr:hypothetical protein lerEdw1_012306 [Lerista edwardsae]